MKTELLKIRNRLHNNYLVGGQEKDRKVIEDFTKLINSLEYTDKEMLTIKYTKPDIENIVCDDFEITKQELYSKSHERIKAMARHVIVWYNFTHMKMIIPFVLSTLRMESRNNGKWHFTLNI
jgi:chromosomal replication initiation ATPase DnaA